MTIYKDGIAYNRLEDLIAGVTPTLVDWTNDPTDAADITDGDINTFCTTGDKVAGAGYQFCYFEWDFGRMENVLIACASQCNVTANAPGQRLHFYDGANWQLAENAMSSASFRVFNSVAARCSEIRLAMYSTGAATITPNVREVHAWRLG